MEKFALVILIFLVYVGIASIVSGCEDQEPNYIYGTVIKEAGTIVDRQRVIESSTEAWVGNDSVRFGDPTYAIQFRIGDGKVYTFTITKVNLSNLEAICLAINGEDEEGVEEGTRIRIEASNFYRYLRGVIGRISESQLEILVPEDEGGSGSGSHR